MIDQNKLIETSRIVKVNVKGGLIVREEPNTISKSIAVIPYNKTIEVGAIYNEKWYLIGYDDIEGWVLIQHTTFIENDISRTPSTLDLLDNLGSNTTTDDNSENKQVFDEEFFKKYEVQSVDPATIIAKNLNGIHGMPYQFMDTTDVRVEGTVFGRKYLERVVNKLPLLIMSPGKVDFMPNSSKKDAASVLMNLAEKAAQIADRSDLSEMLSGSGRYYSFAYNYSEYYSAVNTMCRSGAVFLGIQDVKVNYSGYTSKLESFNWSKMLGTDFGNYFSAKESVVFYVDSVNQVSDSFSNSTTESQLASKVNQYSEIGKEINFLLGTQTGHKFWFNTQDIENTLTSVNDIADKYLKGNQLFKDIGSNFSTIASGGKLIFPQIWDDSSFSRSFDVNLKLRTPDCDKLSWYLNIYVPLCHLICFVAPMQTTPMGYSSPFLVKAFYKGLFNIDLGIVTDMSISKGKEGAWTLDGLPTEVDISMTIKDLYQSILSIVTNDNNSITKAKWFLNNTTLMDYMSNMCGININQPDIQRTLSIYKMLVVGGVKNIPNSIFTRIEQGVTNKVISFYNKIFG